jgi:hypothetical protein
MKLSRRGFITGLLASAVIGHELAASVAPQMVAAELDISGLKANQTYDVFVWNDGGVLRLKAGPAWDSDTCRGEQALVRCRDGFFNKAGQPYVGSVHPNGGYDMGVAVYQPRGSIPIKLVV